MTAQQVAALGRADELPLAASHPKVAVRATLVGESDQCCRHPLQAGEDVAPPGRWAVQYRFDYAHPVRTERVCPDCAQDELQELLDWGVCHLELHLPADWSSMSTVAKDPVFADIEHLKHLIHTMPNTGTDFRSRDGFEQCRRLAVAYVASFGLKRIEQLGRAS